MIDWNLVLYIELFIIFVAAPLGGLILVELLSRHDGSHGEGGDIKLA